MELWDGQVETAHANHFHVVLTDENRVVNIEANTLSWKNGNTNGQGH